MWSGELEQDIIRNLYYARVLQLQVAPNSTVQDIVREETVELESTSPP